MSAINPLLAMRASLVARIPALDGLMPDGELPAQVRLDAEFPDALFWDLAELDPDVIVPGLGEFPTNRVRLLGVNAGFVGAYLVGANHELAREFLWREYPADLTATFFRRFFDYADPADGRHRPDRRLAARLDHRGQPPERGGEHGDPDPRRPRPALPRGQRLPGRRWSEAAKADYTKPCSRASRAGSERDVLVVGFPLSIRTSSNWRRVLRRPRGAGDGAAIRPRRRTSGRADELGRARRDGLSRRRPTTSDRADRASRIAGDSTESCGAGTPRTWRPPSISRRSGGSSPAGGLDQPRARIDPSDPRRPPIDPPQLSPALAFEVLDDELPLALFPVRLEARFLPDERPTEIVVRVFPDEIHVDSHVVGFTGTELKLATRYWEAIWRGGRPRPSWSRRATGWPTSWARIVRSTSRGRAGPEGDRRRHRRRPASPRAAARAAGGPRGASTPGRARLLPLAGAPSSTWARQPRSVLGRPRRATPTSRSTPALVDLPPGADGRAFLERTGLGWTHDLLLAEAAGMVIRIPVSALPDRPPEGYDRLVVVGVGVGQGSRRRGGIAARCPPLHARPRPAPAGDGDQRHRRGARGGRAARRPGALRDRVRPAAVPPPRKAARRCRRPDALCGDRRAPWRSPSGFRPARPSSGRSAPDGPEPELARAANQALWPATWDTCSDQMSWVDDAGRSCAGDIGVLRGWFTDFVRAEGPLPTLRVGRQPYGLLPVSSSTAATAAAMLDHLENTLMDVFDNWFDSDSVPRLDPDASDVAPDEEPPRSRRPTSARSTVRRRTSASSGCARWTTPTAS